MPWKTEWAISVDGRDASSTFNDYLISIAIEEKHDQLSPSGIGYEVAFTVSLVRMDRPDAASIDSMTSLVVNLINQLTLSVTGPIVSAITNIFG